MQYGADHQPQFTNSWNTSDSPATSSRPSVAPLRLGHSSRPQQTFANGLPSSNAPARPMRSAKRASMSPEPQSRQFPQNRFQQRFAQPARPSSGLSFASITTDDDDEEAVMQQQPRSNANDRKPSVDDFENELQFNTPAPAMKPVPSKTMNHVLAALNDAGARNRGKQPVSVPSRARRGGVGEQGESSRMKPKARNYPSTPAFREIERVLQQVEEDWPMLLPLEAEDDPTKTQEFSPVNLALALLDTQGGSNNRLASFVRLKEDLSRAVKSHIQSHYRAFDASVSAYNSTLVNLGSAQKEVVQLRDTLGDVREVLSTKRSELVSMVARRDELSEMSKILDQIDHLKDVPDILEGLLSEKRFLKAVVVLTNSLKSINKTDMLEIGAIADLRAYLHSQESSIYDIIVEELHNHLFLKSYYSESRWKSYTKGQVSLPVIDLAGEDDLLNIPNNATKSPTMNLSINRKPTPLSRFLSSLASKPAIDPLLSESDTDNFNENDPSSPNINALIPPSPLLNGPSNTLTPPSKANPELDPFSYIETLFESLAVLDKTKDALELIVQRLPLEIFNLVEATIDEVEDRNPQRNLSTMSPNPNRSSLAGLAHHSQANTMASLTHLATLDGTGHVLLRLSAAQASALQNSTDILKDLFWTLFSKLDAVMQGFRVAFEMSVRIYEKRSFKEGREKGNSLIISLVEIWKPVQSEVRALLREYLMEDSDVAATSRNPANSVNEILKGIRTSRENKPLFHFTDSDAKHTARQTKPFEDDLNQSLKVSVPGLVHTGAEASTALSSMIASDERVQDGSRVRGIHRLLVAPDAFHVSILFGPTLSFLDRMSEVLPSDITGEEERGFEGFLEDFVQSIYLPQLQEKVTSLLHEAVNSGDAFQEDAKTHTNGGPVFKCIAKLLILVESLCSMLRNTPFHRESYSRFILEVMEQFLFHCSSFYRSIFNKQALQTDDSVDANLRLAAVWAQDEQLLEVFERIVSETPTDDPSEPSELLFQELQLNFSLKDSKVVRMEDLSSSAKQLRSLGNLCSSLVYFISQVQILRRRPLVNNFSQSSLNVPDEVSETTFTLPLTEEMVQRFDKVVSDLTKLTHRALLALRCETRLKAFHHFDKMGQTGLYQDSDQTLDPDGFVVALNSELSECDEILSATLSSANRNLVLVGLPTLTDQLLMNGARRIESVSDAGADKLCRNVIALQQSLKNLGEIRLTVDLTRSRSFYELLRNRNPQQLIDFIKDNEPAPFGLNECKLLLSLICQVSKNGTTSLIAGVDNNVVLFQNALTELKSLLPE